MSRYRIHVLYEHGVDKRPFGSASIRLLRPLTHPALKSEIQISSGLTYEGQEVDAVIVDRLWRPDIAPGLAQKLLDNIRSTGTRVIYALDDSFLDLSAEKKDWDPTTERLQVAKLLLSQADGVLVTTQALKNKFTHFNSNIAVVPHALDERLLPAWRLRTGAEPKPNLIERLAKHVSMLTRCPQKAIRSTWRQRIVIGYMGTLTHDDDLMMILPALRIISQRYQGQIEFEMVGVVGRPDTHQVLQDLPVRTFKLTPKKVEYSRFMSWFSRCLHWDIAIAPLKDSLFNRCKSDIKFLDYSAIGAAGIYSQVPAYEGAVQHKQTGWLAENRVEAWLEALDELISNDSLREQIAQNATHYLCTKRTLTRCAHRWLEAIETLLKRE